MVVTFSSHSFRLASAFLIAITACSPGLPGPSGARPAAVRSDTLWTPPARHARDSLPNSVPLDLPPDLVARRTALSLEDVVALALEGSPDARASWAAARASAAGLGAARGAWFPEITGDASATRIKTAATQGRTAVQQTLYEPSVSFTWLLLDIGGRTGQISVARNALISANWTHNATLQSVVARAAAAYFDYAAAKALLTAQQATVNEAGKNLASAEERRRVGLATIADVLQARTAFAQARLDLQTLEGSLLTTRGALAAATGHPATLQFDIDTLAVEAPVSAVSAQVDTLITAALRDRPDLAAMRADYDAARARIGVARAQRLPSITAGGSAGINYRSDQTGGRSSYSLTVGLSIPIFNGFIWEYNQQQAEHNAEAALARAQGLTQQVIFQVFQSYYSLQTQAARVGTADELRASATESAEAARGRYQAGVGSLLELLSAENSLAAARAQRIQARLGWQAALVQLAKDAGLLDVQGRSSIRMAPTGAPTDSLP